MTGGLSGKQSAAINLERFTTWVSERRSCSDWHDYIHSGKLSRKDMAAECDFAVSVLRQNPAVRAALSELEAKLRKEGVLPDVQEATAELAAVEQTPGLADDASTAMATDIRAALVAASAEKRLKVVEEQNASLRAEIRQLQQKLKKYSLLDEHLAETGRLLPP